MIKGPGFVRGSALTRTCFNMKGAVTVDAMMSPALAVGDDLGAGPARATGYLPMLPWSYNGSHSTVTSPT